LELLGIHNCLIVSDLDSQFKNGIRGSIGWKTACRERLLL
jgi:hypothetical protein